MYSKQNHQQREKNENPEIMRENIWKGSNWAINLQIIKTVDEAQLKKKKKTPENGQNTLMDTSAK